MPSPRSVALAQQNQSLNFTRIPMPVSGLNFVDNVLTMGAEYAYLLDNFLCQVQGVEVRKGWKYRIPQDSKFSAEVRTIIPFVAKVPANSKLFCAPATAASPIYDTTVENTAPTLSMTPSTPPTVPGEWYFTNYVTPDTAGVLLVAAGAGYYIYSEVAGWVEVTTGTGTNKLNFPAGDTTTTKDLCYIWLWKSRVWFLKQNSSVAYYLPIGQQWGNLSKFDFGPLMKRGGSLSFGTNWTYDAGDGMDDALIVVSEQGDFIVYRGNDPSSSTDFTLSGVWFAGRMPYGRRGFCSHGGDVLLLTEYGVIKTSDLVAGRLKTADVQSSDLAFRVNNRWADFISQSLSDKYWFLLPYATESLLFGGSPFIDPITYKRQSLAMSSLTNAWSTFSDLDILCAEVWKGQFYFGTRDGFVCSGFDGYRDGDYSDGSVLGQLVTGRLQTGFFNLDSFNFNKLLTRAKIYGLVGSQPSLAIRFVPEYNFEPVPDPSVPAADDRALWDVAIWDHAVWASDLGTLNQWIGTAAFGKKLSLQLSVRGPNRVLLTDFEVCYKVGFGL